MSEQPARLAGLDHRKGAIRVGNDADLTSSTPTENAKSTQSNSSIATPSHLTLVRC